MKALRRERRSINSSCPFLLFFFLLLLFLVPLLSTDFLPAFIKRFLGEEGRRQAGVVLACVEEDLIHFHAVAAALDLIGSLNAVDRMIVGVEFHFFGGQAGGGVARLDIWPIGRWEARSIAIRMVRASESTSSTQSTSCRATISTPAVAENHVRFMDAIAKNIATDLFFTPSWKRAMSVGGASETPPRSSVQPLSPL